MITGLVTLKGHPAPKGQLEKLPLYVGIDVGRHRHPAHMAALMPDFTYRHKLYQVASVWFDDEPYLKQIETIESILRRIPHSKEIVLYDNTRGEYGVLQEAGKLPKGWHGFVFSLQNKFVMASKLLVYLDEGRLVLLGDKRQKESLLAVNNMLRAAESESGHGESFSSLMLALEAADAGWGRSVLERYVPDRGRKGDGRRFYG